MDSHDPIQYVDQQTNRQYAYTILTGSARAHLGDHVVHHHHYHAPTERAETPPLPSSTVPFRPNEDFINRGTILTEIERRCEERAGCVALVGIGGVGKSQLAIEYCHRLHERSPDTWVFWVYASNTARIEQGYREIAEAAKIPGRNDPQANIFKLVKWWLRSEKKGKWLLVLDNVDNDLDLTIPQETGGSHDHQISCNPRNLKYQPRSLSDYIPQSQNGAVLVTTRTTSVAHRLVEPRDTIHIDPMLKTEAVNLLAKKLNAQTDDTDLQELAAVLEFMPLAIVQAAAYIQKRAPRCSAQQYIIEFKESDQVRTKLLSHEAGHLRRDTEAKNSIIITWQISFDYLREMRPSAADLLSLMSFFDRQGIPERLLTARSHERKENVRAQQDEGHEPATNGTKDFETDLDWLRDYSFASVEADGRTLAMHRLVQLTTRRWLVQHGQDAKYRSLFLSKLNAGFPTGAYENWTHYEALFPHAKAAEEQQPEHSENDESMQYWARILLNAGWYALARGHYTEAERMCSKSIRSLEGRSDLDDIEVSYSRGILATVYKYQGRWKEAEELDVQVMETFKRVLSAEHPDTLTSMANVASTYRNQGRWKEAEELDEQVMETRKRVLGAEHPDTLTSMSNLAHTLKHQDHKDKAIELITRCMELCIKVLGPSHHLTQNVLMALMAWQIARLVTEEQGGPRNNRMPGAWVD